MKSIYPILFFFVLAGGSAHAQQDAMYSQYMFNTLAINPAYAGSREVLSVTALNRSQWAGMDGAPQTTTLSVHSPVSSQRVGLGLQLFHDKVGIARTTGAYFCYAYRIKMEKSMLSLGLQAGLSSFKADYTSVDLGSTSPNDASFRDPVNKVLPNFGFGVYYSAEKFFLGASVPHLLKNNLTEKTNSSDELIARHYRHYMLMGGYSLKLGEKFRLTPSALLKGVKGAPAQLDVNANLWLREFIALGVSYRVKSAVVGLVQIQPTPQLRIGYSYDYGINGLADYYSGSHEVMLRYEFSFDKDKVIGPRNF